MTMPPKPTAPASGGFQLPVVYRLFFLLIEPIAAAVGAYYAHFQSHDYLTLTHAASAPTSIATTGPDATLPLGTAVTLSQLANMYFFFALNEALVLRSTGDIRVWKTVLFCLLVGDAGHLYALRGLGLGRYFDVLGWNAIDWGNLAFVYFGVLMRVGFLAGVGLPRTAGPGKQKP